MTNLIRVSKTSFARILGVLMPPTYVGLGLLLPQSSASESLGPLIFIASGFLIGRWWAPLPSFITFAALGLAELANAHGVGLGTRFGSAIQVHSDFDLRFFLFVSTVAIASPLAGFAARAGLSAPIRRLAHR